MNCLKCGSPVGNSDKFCMICGTPVGQAAPQGGQPAPGPAQFQAPPVPVNPNPVPPTIPYAPPTMQGNCIVIPRMRKYRIVCPDCHSVSEFIKQDDTPGFPCNNCGKAYAYGGQVLFYRMGNGMPSCAVMPVNIMIDGVVYGEIKNRESVRVMLSAGTHVIGVQGASFTTRNSKSNQFQIVVGPQTYNFAFKVSVYFRYMNSDGLDFAVCNPEEVPNI